MSLNEFSVVYEDIDDGYFPGQSCHSNDEKVKVSKIALHKNKKSSSFLSVFDGLLSEEWASRIYKYALEYQRPWGIYITKEDATNDNLKTEDLFSTNPEKAMALEATRALFYGRGKGIIGDDFQYIHGTAVWCLASGITDTVEYHIDYAELYRYESSIIHPPIYAGTYHVTPVPDGGIEGGDFMANVEGLDHYKKYGYKGRLSTPEELESNISNSSSWSTVRFRHNRGIMMDGDLPHLSTKITRINDGHKRVIFGLNCFTVEPSESLSRAPEHSNAFNRTVKLYQTLAHLSGDHVDFGSKYSKVEASTTDSELSIKEDKEKSVTQPKSGGVTAKDLKKNPALAKLLVLAARKVKEEEARKIALAQSSSL